MSLVALFLIWWDWWCARWWFSGFSGPFGCVMDLACFRFDVVFLGVALCVCLGYGGLLAVVFGVFACTLWLSVCGFGDGWFLCASGGDW